MVPPTMVTDARALWTTLAASARAAAAAGDRASAATPGGPSAVKKRETAKLQATTRTSSNAAPNPHPTSMPARCFPGLRYPSALGRSRGIDPSDLVTRPSCPAIQLDVEAELDDVAVVHHVVLALDADLACRAGGGQ